MGVLVPLLVSSQVREAKAVDDAQVALSGTNIGPSGATELESQYKMARRLTAREALNPREGRFKRRR